MPVTDPDVAAAIGHVRRELSALPTAAHGIVVGCSGGADSVALLGVLVKAVGARPDGPAIHVAHVDHGLRPASADEARAVKRLAADLGRPCVVRRLDLAPGPGLPARARAARHATLWSIADEVGASVVALAHTATDQAETVLLHLCRGAGLAGLSGMRPVTPAAHRATGDVWRPLLGIDRAGVRRICAALGLTWSDDPTNDDIAPPRTRIRHLVLPQLREIRGGVDLAIARAAEVIAEADDALGRRCDEELALRRLADDGVTTRWSTDGWPDVPISIRLRMLRRMCTDAGVPVDGLSARTVRSIDTAVCRGGEPHAWDLHPGVRLAARGAQLTLERGPRVPPGSNH